MGEIPLQATVHFTDEDVMLTIYGCNECKRIFGIEGYPYSQETFCPICGKQNTWLLEEYT